jgi:hypothetical protein
MSAVQIVTTKKNTVVIHIMEPLEDNHSFEGTWAVGLLVSPSISSVLLMPCLELPA